MIHLSDATTQLSRVICTIRLPGPALGAPLRSPIAFTDKHVLAVKVLESGAVRILVRRVPWARLGILWLWLLPPAAFRLKVSIPLFLFLLSYPVVCPWYSAGVRLRGIEDANVWCDREREEYGV